MNMLNVRTFRRAACDMDHYVVVAKVRERLAVSKQEAQMFDVERFNLKKLSELDVTNYYQIVIYNSFGELKR
jgi:hypothetical protein